MAGYDPSAVASPLEGRGNVGDSDLQGSGRFGGGLVSELADRAVLVGGVLLVADGRGSRGAGQRHRQDDDPGAPTTASSEPPVRGSSLDHLFSTLAEIAGGRKGLAAEFETRSRNCPPGLLDATRPSGLEPTATLDSGSLLQLQ